MSKQRKITILQLNDSHGYFEPHPELFWEGDRETYKKTGGYTRISTLFQQARDENPNGVVALDNGDTIHGTFPAGKNEGMDLVSILNYLEFEAMTAHWEFAYGPKQLNEVVKKLDFPMIALNCYYIKDRRNVYKAYHIVEKKGLQIGIIGIAATIVDKTMPPHFSDGLYFTLGKEELSTNINILRQEERVDLIIVLSHLGYPQEIQLANDVNGIDVLLSGHTHNRIYEPVLVNGAIIIQSGCHGSFIGRLDLNVTENKKKLIRHELITVDEAINPDPNLENLVDRVLDSDREKLETIVGETKIALNRSRSLESTMDNVILNAIKEKTRVDLAFSNGWRYGAPILPGSIKMNDVWNIIPTNPPISMCELTGDDLWRMMEENLEHTFSRNPYMQMGGYVKRCSGLNIYFKVENPKGRRIHDFYIGGKRLEKTKKYKACFITTQGVPAKYGSNKENLDMKAVDVLAEYLDINSPVVPEYEHPLVPI